MESGIQGEGVLNRVEWKWWPEMQLISIYWLFRLDPLDPAPCLPRPPPVHRLVSENNSTSTLRLSRVCVYVWEFVAVWTIEGNISKSHCLCTHSRNIDRACYNVCLEWRARESSHANIAIKSCQSCLARKFVIYIFACIDFVRWFQKRYAHELVIAININISSKLRGCKRKRGSC